jgi:TolA-binding protein
VAYRNDSVIAVIGDMVNVKLNAEVDTLTARKYGIAGYPTIVLCNADGTEIDRIYGYLEPPEFAQTIRDYLVGKNTLADYLARAAKEPSVAMDYIIADKYVGRSKFADAEACYRKIIAGDPDNKQGHTDSSYYALGDLKRRAKDYTGAIAAFKDYIARYPKLDGAIDAELDIASCYNRMGSKDEALKVYQQYLVNHPQSSDTTYVKKQIDKILNPPPKKEEKK